MKGHNLFLCVFSCALILGCLPSFHPFCTDEMEVSLPEIDGAWQVIVAGEADPGQRKPWVFSGKDVTVYDDQNRMGRFKVTYFRIDDTLYADVISADAQDEINREWLCHMLPVHNLCKVVLEGNKAEIWGFDHNAFKQGVENGTIDLPHMKRDEFVFFTATPKQWVAFLQENAKKDHFYQEKPLYVLQRVQAHD